MEMFDNVGAVIIYALIIPFLLTVAEAVWMVRDIIVKIIGNQRDMERWLNNELNLDDMNSLTPKEFEYWCGEFISKLGYDCINQSGSSSDSGIDILCTKNHIPVYVECQKYKSSGKRRSVVDDQVCKKLIGAMVPDQITKGLIITSGKITTSALSYIRTLPKVYEIELLDGNDIVRGYAQIKGLQPQTT